jgi:hypothetical protein
MQALTDLSWRIYPASALMALGAAVLFLGLRLEVEGIRHPTGDPIKMVTVVKGFRFAVVGVAPAGLDAAWSWHITWLFVQSLVFGGEEILESSVHLFILRRRPPHWRPMPRS